METQIIERTLVRWFVSDFFSKCFFFLIQLSNFNLKSWFILFNSFCCCCFSSSKVKIHFVLWLHLTANGEKKNIYMTCSNSCSIIAVLSLLYFAWSERVFTCVSERVSLCGRRFKSESQSNGFFVDRSRIWVASHSLLFPLPPFIRLCEEKKKKKRFPFCLLWLGEPVQSQGRYIQRVTRVISTSRRSH